jgi:hypothetical protein
MLRGRWGSRSSSGEEVVEVEEGRDGVVFEEKEGGARCGCAA